MGTEPTRPTPPTPPASSRAAAAAFLLPPIPSRPSRPSRPRHGREVLLSQAFLELAPDAIVVADAAGRIVLVNHQTEVLFGSPGPALLGRPVEQLLPTRFHAAHARHRAAYVAAPHTRPMGAGLALFGQRADGSEFPVEVSLGPVDLGEEGLGEEGLGEGVLVVAIIRDVSVQRRLERERAAQAERLRLQADLIDAAHDAILVRDPTGRILAWNHGAEELYGWTAPEALGRVTHTLFQTRFPLSRADTEAQLARDGRWEGELVHTRPDGREVVVESRQIVVQDARGTPTAVLEINRDITARRRWEEAQSQAHSATLAQRAFLQDLLDAVPSSLCVVHGHEARLVVANRAAADLWGAVWQPGQPMHTFLEQHNIRIVDAQGRASPPDTWATMRALRQEQTVFYHEEFIQRPAGDRVPVLVNALPLVSAHWQGLGLRAQGIAQGAWSDAAAAAGAGELGAAGVEREPAHPEQPEPPEPPEHPEPVALVIHQDVSLLKEAERLKDEFITLAAHELRTPIAAILGYAQMLQPRPPSGDPGVGKEAGGEGETPSASLEEWQREAAESVLQSTQRLVALTDDLLDATRLQAGRLALHPEPGDLVALARRVLRRQRGAAVRHTLELAAPGNYVVVEMDAGRIEQVLTNLVHNAIKYSPAGGVITVTITVDGANVAAGTGWADGGADDGTGRAGHGRSARPRHRDPARRPAAPVRPFRAG